MESLRQEIELSLQRFEELWQKAQAEHPEKQHSWQHYQWHDLEQNLLAESLEELSHSLEELRVMSEELHQQNKELTESREALERERQRYRALFDFAPDCYLMTTKEGTILEANQSVGKLFGISPKYLWRKPISVLLCPGDRKNLPSKLAQLQRNRSVGENWELTFVRRDRNCFRAVCTVTAVWERDRIVELYWRLKESEEGQVTAALVGKEPSQPKLPSSIQSRLTLIAANEIRNPLNQILMYTQLLEKLSSAKDEQKNDLIEGIKTGSKHIVYIIDELIALDKLGNKNKTKPALIDINLFCRQLSEELQQQDGQRHRLIVVSDFQYSGIWDSSLLRFILANLLLNAIKYSPQGSEVGLELKKTEEAILIQVKDRGIGILEQDREFIFEAFYRGSNSQEVSGSGLGLSIVKQCVDRLGGAIAFESEVGVGTVFTVTLPINESR